MLSRQSSRPYTVGSFRMKLTLFEQFIQEFTYVDEELNPEERQQILQARLTNGRYMRSILTARFHVSRYLAKSECRKVRSESSKVYLMLC